MPTYRKAAAVALLLALGFGDRSAFAQQLALPDSTATRCAGAVCTIEGTVAQVSVSHKSGTTFLNFGAAYPHQTFAAVIFRAARSHFPDPKQWEGRPVRVTGNVRVYRGKPEMILVAASQLNAAP
jgi:DNA/RNA endonuclease YhcR with UshA esterase domain